MLKMKRPAEKDQTEWREKRRSDNIRLRVGITM